ncbi:MAG: hypothetical protein ACK5UE_00180 [Chitinophagales bacterium]|nr:hypothetical protein [Sphingobacteriales bacterium]
MSKTTKVIVLYAASIACIFLSIFTDTIMENLVFTSLSIFLSLSVFKILKENVKLTSN